MALEDTRLIVPRYSFLQLLKRSLIGISSDNWYFLIDKHFSILNVMSNFPKSVLIQASVLLHHVASQILLFTCLQLFAFSEQIVLQPEVSMLLQLILILSVVERPFEASIH